MSMKRTVCLLLGVLILMGVCFPSAYALQPSGGVYEDCPYHPGAKLRYAWVDPIYQPDPDNPKQYHLKGDMMGAYCTVCGYYIGAIIQDEHREQHTFQNGRCTKCGYHKTTTQTAKPNTNPTFRPSSNDAEAILATFFPLVFRDVTGDCLRDRGTMVEMVGQVATRGGKMRETPN